MFEDRILKVVDTIKKDTIFATTGFVKDTKVQGGFLGITDEYTDYFYARIESEDAASDPYIFQYEDPKKITVTFNFKLVFSMAKDITGFDVLMMQKINKTSGVKVVGLDNVTESVYLRETASQLKNENFTLYSFSCEYSKETILANLVTCIGEDAKQLFC